MPPFAFKNKMLTPPRTQGAKRKVSAPVAETLPPKKRWRKNGSNDQSSVPSASSRSGVPLEAIVVKPAVHADATQPLFPIVGAHGGDIGTTINVLDVRSDICQDELVDTAATQILDLKAQMHGAPLPAKKKRARSTQSTRLDVVKKPRRAATDASVAPSSRASKATVEYERDSSEAASLGLLRRLTKVEEKSVNDTFSTRRSLDDMVAVGRSDLPITREALMTLKPREWLDTVTIDAYLNLLMKRQEESSASCSSCYFFHSSLWTMELSGSNAKENFARYLADNRVNVAEFTKLVMPMNCRNHWFIIVVDFIKEKIVAIDSMQAHGIEHMKLMQRFRDLLVDHTTAVPGSGGIDLESFALSVPDVPQQTNNFDCGVLACVAANYISLDRKLDYRREEMSSYRRLICSQILSGSLSG